MPSLNAGERRTVNDSANRRTAPRRQLRGASSARHLISQRDHIREQRLRCTHHQQRRATGFKTLTKKCHRANVSEFRLSFRMLA